MVHCGSLACYSYGCEAYRLKYVKMPAFAGTAKSSNTIWKHCYRIWWLSLLHRLGKTQPEGRVKGSPATSAQHFRDISAVPGDEHGVAKHWVAQSCSRPRWPLPAQHLPFPVGFGQPPCRSAFRGFPEDQGWDDGGFWPMRSPVLRALPGPASAALHPGPGRISLGLWALGAKQAPGWAFILSHLRWSISAVPGEWICIENPQLLQAVH